MYLLLDMVVYLILPDDFLVRRKNDDRKRMLRLMGLEVVEVSLMRSPISSSIDVNCSRVMR